ncbi:hypothetical protein AVEN_236865-1, partial [Araneus ventricosus]
AQMQVILFKAAEMTKTRWKAGAADMMETRWEAGAADMTETTWKAGAAAMIEERGIVWSRQVDRNKMKMQEQQR